MARAAGLLAALCLFARPAVAAAQTGAAEALDLRPWELALQWLTDEHRRFAAALEAAHGPLVARARAEQPELVERLSPEPPQARPTGYGILPALEPDAPLTELPPRRQRYSIEELTTAYAADLRDAGLLALEAEGRPAAALEPMVARFERLKKRLENLQDHLEYHEFWQPEVVTSRGFFARQNETLALVEQWQELERSGGDPDRRAEMRREIAVRVAPFQPTAGLSLESDGGGWTLPITVLTDITDERFLTAFRQAVHSSYSDSAAARERRFRVELSIEIVPPARLYPEGVPEPGSAIDEREHIRRFPAGSLVLTTGAESTHAWTGHYVQLGSSPMPRRNLAHEFGHLLGFADGYLRAYEGRPEDRFGAVLIEWQDLLEGLMGSPSRGRVTPEMISRLFESYGQRSSDRISSDK